jgi:hypothetical protein
MAYQGAHFMLVQAREIESGMAAVRKFLDETLLIQYDSVRCRKSQSYAATGPEFWRKLDEVIARNREILQGFIAELEADGLRVVADLQGVSQGYQSKLLHIIAHFLDGFIGIDTVFYNLLDDSHWLTETTRKSILASPESYWLIQVDTAFADRKKASLV